MTQTLVVVVLFVGSMALLPWLVRKMQQRQGGMRTAAGGGCRVVSAVAVGPQQRVVTVEVGPENARAWLVLGVTAQQIQCLHVVNQPAAASHPVPTSFATEVEAASAEQNKGTHV